MHFLCELQLNTSSALSVRHVKLHDYAVWLDRPTRGCTVLLKGTGVLQTPRKSGAYTI